MTTTPKDPVDALMALVRDYHAATCQTFREGADDTDDANLNRAWKALEASARALAAVPAADDQPSGKVYKSVDELMASTEGSPDAWLHKYRRFGSTYEMADLADPKSPPEPREGYKWVSAEPLFLCAQQAGGVPAGFVLVPLSFLQGFHTLSHNYSLRAVPPDYYRGVEGDAFSAAYKRCGEDLAKLRAMLAAAPSPNAVQPLTAEQALRDALEAMGSKKAQELSAGDLMAVVCYVDASTSPSAVQPLSEAQIEVLRFLDGLGDLHGFGFGDKPPTERGNYWWRKDLRTAFPDVDFGIVTNESST